MNGKCHFKLVLMSATFDQKSFTNFLEPIDRSGYVNTFTLPDSDSSIYYVREVYLDSIADLLEDSVHINNYRTLCQQYLHNYESVESKVDLGIYSMVTELIRHIHINNSSYRNSILVFIPTYKMIEIMYATLSTLLKNSNNDLWSTVDVVVMHSSVDVEKCVQECTMSLDFPAKRKIILSSNISESSVTIVDCFCVIDLCRNLEMTWNIGTQLHDPKVIWCSKSQANQRKGRTGRTCDGTVYRLIPQRVNETVFPSYEKPALLIGKCYCYNFDYY